MVPRLRIWKCPICGAALASNGTDSAIRGSCIKLTCLVVAPTTRVPLSRRTSLSSGTRLMSTSCSGRDRRSASMGTRLCPPASTLASPLNCPSRDTAASTLSGT